MDRRSGRASGTILPNVGVDLSYCVVNTDGREHLLACVDAILATHPEGVESELLVLDNASDDGSAEAVSERFGDRVRLIERKTRTGKAENDTRLLREAQGEYCLLLNEDAELRPGATAALLEALRADPGAAAAGAKLCNAAGEPQQCAWRFPSVGTALAGALLLHRFITVESGGSETRTVGWVQSSAMLVRREAAAEVDYLDPEFFVYSDETDFCKRLADAGWRILHVPAAEAVHYDQLVIDRSAGSRRVLQLHPNPHRYI